MKFLRKTVERLFGSNSPATDAQDTPSVRQETADYTPPLSREEYSSLLRALRKVALTTEEQVTQIQSLDAGLQVAMKVANLQESDWLSVLDRLYQLFEVLRLEENRWADELMTQISALERLARFHEIASLGNTIDPTECQVVSTVLENSEEHGTVHSIVRQGYKRPDGSIVREAVVILVRNRSESFVNDAYAAE